MTKSLRRPRMYVLPRLRLHPLEERWLPASLIGLTGLIQSGGPANSLLFFDSATPGTITRTVPVTGLGADVLVGIDFRPTDGLLYGVSTTRLYLIDSTTGAATPVGAPFPQPLRGRLFGTDFDPVGGQLRVISNREDNYRINPANGQVTVATSLTGADGNDVIAAGGIAYDRNTPGATASTLFGIDANDSELITIGGIDGNPSPDTGVTGLFNPLGPSVARPAVGFEIAPDGSAYAALAVYTSDSGGTDVRLFAINLKPGGQDAANEIGTIDKGNIDLIGLTVAPPPQVRFDPAPAAVSEAVGTLTLTVRRTGDLSGQATVSVAALSGTATAGSDFTPFSQTVTFAPGQVTAAVPIVIVNDTAVERNETIVFSLTSPLTGVTIGQPSTVTVTIVDNDRAVIATGAGPGGGPHVRVFDAQSRAPLLSFFAYGADFRGGVHVATGDVTGDGVEDVVTGPGEGGGPLVRVFDGVTGRQVLEFLAYAADFRGGIWVAAGDVTGDRRADIITGAGRGGGPHVKVFDGATGALLNERMAYDPTFRGGVTVAAGDVDGDGLADVITGAGGGGGPHVKVYDSSTATLLGEFFAFDATQRFGVTVAAGDVNGDGGADVIVGNGAGGGQAAVGGSPALDQPFPLTGGPPQVRVFSLDLIAIDSLGPSGGGPRQLADFFAYDSTGRSGVNVAAEDVDLDGHDDILTGPGRGSRGPVRILASNSGVPVGLATLQPFDPTLLGGIFVG